MNDPGHGDAGGGLDRQGRPPRDRPLVLVADLGSLVLDDHDRHHLGRVLRVSRGDPVSAADGEGRWRPARWSGDALEPVGDVCDEPPVSPSITVGFAPTKGDRPAWAVQKLTELGVDRIVVLEAERSVVRWQGGRAAQHLERLRRVCREAAMQSRRARVPAVEGPAPVGSLVAQGAVLAEPGAPLITGAHAMALVGPEGGWTETELQGAVTVGLGDGVLRTETAALAAAVLLTHARHSAASDVGYVQ